MITKYKNKIRFVSALLTFCFIFLIGVTLSKIGIFPLSSKDYGESQGHIDVVEAENLTHERIPGDILDCKGRPILINEDVVSKSVLNYHKSYSHLLGNLHLNDYKLLNRNYDTLISKKSPDIVESKGYSLSLCINDTVQKYAYSLTEGSRASIVVLRRNNGEILTLTSTYKDDFDLSGELTDERLAKYNSSREPVWTAEYQNAYEPGSTQKIFSAAVGIEAGLKNHTINDIGYIDYGNNKTIPNYANQIFGDNLSMTDAFCHSSNTYFASLINQIEIGKIRKAASSMLLNSSIDSDFGEITNTFSFGDYSDHDIGWLAVGQKSTLSSVGLAMTVQGIIENRIYRPHVIKNTYYTAQDGSLKTISSTEEEILSSDIFSDSTCAEVRKMMETAARSDGYLLNPIILGAKSGTAEIKINDENTDRAVLVGYNEDYIVVISKIEKDCFGIHLKGIMEDIFLKLCEADSPTC